MDDDQAREMEALEGILLDPSAESIKLSYGLLKFITQNFSTEYEIGRGGFGVVYKGYLENEVVAVKVCTDVVTNKQFMDEIECLKSANHQNIVRFLGYCAQKQEEIVPLDGKFVMAGERYRLLCFEYVPQGNIREYLEREKPHRKNWLARYQMITGICQGLKHLHDNKIHHRDLKPENVMLDAHMEAKITDFGLSRFLDEGETKMYTENIRGTMRYMAPEVIDRKEISYKSDIYALGIIIVELLTGTSLISLQNWDESLDFLKCPRVETCAEIAQKCIDAERDNRPTIDEVIGALVKLESTIAKSSTNQESDRVFSETELLDAYPLEFRFPFEPNGYNSCSVGLINKTDNEVGFIVVPYFDTMNREWDHGSLTAKSTQVVELTLEYQEELVPLDRNEVMIIMIMIKPDEDVRQFVSEALKVDYGEKSWYIGLQEKVEVELGGKFHYAMLTAVVCDDGPTKMIPVFSQGREHDGSLDAIKSMEVHARRPWVLVQLSSGTVSVWDWRIRKKICTRPGPAASAIFISSHDWIVIGDVSAGFFFVYSCPYMELVKKVTPQMWGVLHSGPITSLAAHPTSSYLMTYSELDNTLILTDWENDWSCQKSFEDVPPMKRLMFNPNNIRFFSVLTLNDSTQTWDIIEGRPDESQYATNMDYLSPNRNNDRNWITSYDSKAHIWDCRTGTQVHSIDIGRRITLIACHPTEALFVVTTWEGGFQVWDSATYRLKKEYNNIRGNPIDIAFIGTTRLLIAYYGELSILEIDLQ